MKFSENIHLVKWSQIFFFWPHWPNCGLLLVDNDRICDAYNGWMFRNESIMATMAIFRPAGGQNEKFTISQLFLNIPDRKVHGADRGPIWFLSSPGGPHVCPINLAIRDIAALSHVGLWRIKYDLAITSRDLLVYKYVHMDRSYIFAQLA